MKKTKILMVCLGNICRSPLAEGILKSKVEPSKVIVESAGTGHWHVGKSPDPRSIAIAKKHDINITDQRGRQFKASDFEEYDFIYVMDNSNKSDVLELAQNAEHRQKVKLLLDELFPGENVDVPDPYYGGTVGFENVYKMIDEACEKIAQNL